MGSPQSRRKRRRTFRAQSTFRKQTIARMVPFLAIIGGVAMIVIMCIRRALRPGGNRFRSRRSHAMETMPLAILLQEQHEINSQAAIYADSAGRCLSPARETSLPPQHLGPFTCVADTLFFVRALVLAMGYVNLILVDVGNPFSWAGGGPAAATAALLGRSSAQDLNMRLQGHITEEEEPPDVGADIIIISVHEERSAEAWSRLIRKCLKATAEGGHVVINSQQGLGWGSSNRHAGEAPVGDTSAQGNIALREAVAALVCDDEADAAAVIGDLDGGVVLLRHGNADVDFSEWSCSSNRATSGEARSVDAVAIVAHPQPLQFEEFFLWATRGGTGTEAVESIRAEFGGVEAMHHNALRRIHRSACFDKSTVHVVLDSIQEKSGNANKKNKKSKKSKAKEKERGRADRTGEDRATPATESDVRKCLAQHLTSHPDDVRALFALEMIWQASRGKRKWSSRLRQEVLSKSGEAGEALYAALYAQSATVAAGGIAG